MSVSEKVLWGLKFSDANGPFPVSVHNSRSQNKLCGYLIVIEELSVATTVKTRKILFAFPQYPRPHFLTSRSREPDQNADLVSNISRERKGHKFEKKKGKQLPRKSLSFCPLTGGGFRQDIRGAAQ